MSIYSMEGGVLRRDDGSGWVVESELGKTLIGELIADYTRLQAELDQQRDEIQSLRKQLADSQAHSKIVECKIIGMMWEFPVESSEFRVLNRAIDLFYASAMEGE